MIKTSFCRGKASLLWDTNMTQADKVLYLLQPTEISQAQLTPETSRRTLKSGESTSCSVVFGANCQHLVFHLPHD